MKRMELVVMNEIKIKYVATFHGLNGFGNSIQTYPSKDGFVDFNAVGFTDTKAIELATSNARTMAPFLPDGTVNVVVSKVETKTLDTIFDHNHTFHHFLNDLKESSDLESGRATSCDQETEELFYKLLGVPHGVVKRFNYVVADMFDEIVYEATGKHLEDYIAEKRVKEIANFTITSKPKEGDNLCEN